MNFATLAYGLFLLVVVTVYWLLPRRAGLLWLLVAGFVFYASWNPIYVPGFMLWIGANFGLGLMAAGPHRRLAVVLAVVLDLGLLAVFKYADWALGTSSAFLAWLTGSGVSYSPLGLVLPLAISFVTFTMLAYIFDTSRGAPPERNLFRFSLFITFFPHLIAGPIMRGRELLPQLKHPRRFSVLHLRVAAPLLVSGLIKKLMGDALAPSVQRVFADPSAHSTAALWLGALAFAFQIFFDFSGYTDLALGSAALLGFHLPANFNWPCRSLSIRDFWRRWHMTLSRWLRDYLYIALGGSRHGRTRTYIALMVTMVLGGLWHGAGLTFLVWGTWHGVGLAVNRWNGEREGRRIVAPAIVAWGATFLFVLLGWVFFRAPSLGSALDYLRGMFTVHGGSFGIPAGAVVFLVLAVIGQWPGWVDLVRRVVPPRTVREYAAVGVGAVVAVMLIPVHIPNFIYFQF